MELQPLKVMPPLSAIGTHWREITGTFLKLGTLSFGGLAIVGAMQSELQERRRWVSKERFLEGLSLINMLPGGLLTQMSIFLGSMRGGWFGGLLGGCCFLLPSFVIMVVLAASYSSVATLPLIRAMLYGIGPAVLGIFVVATVRLGRTSVRSTLQVLIALGAAALHAIQAAGIAELLLLAGGFGLLFYYSPRWGITVVVIAAALILGLREMQPFINADASVTFVTNSGAPQLADVGLLFLKIGAFSFGGGLAMIAFIQDEVVNRLGWLTSGEFIDALAVSQLVPGPMPMVAAFIGYKLAGVAGAIAAALAIFLPSFLLMLSIVPYFERIRRQLAVNAAFKGVGPAVIGILAVAIMDLAPTVLHDVITVALLVAAIALVLWFKVSTVTAVAAGALIGVARMYWPL